MVFRRLLEPSLEIEVARFWLSFEFFFFSFPLPLSKGKSRDCQWFANCLQVKRLFNSEEILDSQGRDAHHFTMENYFVVFILRFLTLVLNLAGVFSFKMY